MTPETIREDLSQPLQNIEGMVPIPAVPSKRSVVARHEGYPYLEHTCRIYFILPSVSPPSLSRGIGSGVTDVSNKSFDSKHFRFTNLHWLTVHVHPKICS
jgi:hypothetical protein